MATVEFQELGSLPLTDISTILPIPDVHEEEDDDIYRGLPEDQSPPITITIPPPPPRPESSMSGSSSSSSSRYSVSRTLGALAAVVEHAITRWAGRNSSSSSLTTSNSSNSSTPSVQTKSTRRKRRRDSADHNARSERDILARIRARQETRRIPRGFSLYVPPQLRTPRTRISASDSIHQYDEQGVLRTHLLPAVLNRVQHALRLSEKLRHPERVIQKDNGVPAIVVTDGVPSSPLVTQGHRRRTGKGKQRDPSRMSRERVPKPIPNGAAGSEKGSWPSWWLDVSSPTYGDMKALGKVRSAFRTTTILCSHIFVLTHLLAAPPSPADPGGYSTPGSTRENGTRIAEFVRSSFVDHAPRKCSPNSDTIS